jgi:hypothetical protein
MYINKLHRLLSRRFMDQAGDPPGGGGGGSGNQPQTFSAEYVRELRAENKGLRLKAIELQGKVDGFDKEKADAIAAEVAKAVEKAKADALAEATTAADQRVLRAKLEGEAIKAGLRDVDQLQLLDLAGVTLKDGKLEGAEALFTKLKESKPYLFGEPSNNSSNTQNPPPASDQKPKHVSEMTDAEYSAARAKLGL